MVSNDVEALGVGDACEALLLTAKARVIAPLVVVRRGLDDFLLLTEPGLAETVRRTLVRTRFAAKCSIEVEAHESRLVVGREPPPGGIANLEYGIAAYELVDEETPAWGEITDEELELLRIRAGSPRFGHEIDDRDPSRRRRASRRARSTSRRAATPVRSRSRGSTTAGA